MKVREILLTTIQFSGLIKVQMGNGSEADLINVCSHIFTARFISTQIWKADLSSRRFHEIYFFPEDPILIPMFEQSSVVQQKVV